MAKITNAVAQDFLNALDDAANAGGGAAVIKVYSGSPPATADDALTIGSTHTLLATLTFSAIAFQNAAGSAAQQATMDRTDPITDGTAVADGTPEFCRIETSAGTVVCQLSAGLSSGGGNPPPEVVFAAAITTGATVSISTLQIQQPLG